MALSMSVPMEFHEAFEHYDFRDQEYCSDLTDTEDEEEFASTPRAFEQVVPRCLKRTYGVLIGSVAPERRLRSRIDEQLELLRAIIPNSCTDEKASVLTDAYEYIEKLQRQVNELHCELETDSCIDLSPYSSDRLEDFTPCPDSSPVSHCACPQPTVEVMRNEEGLKIHIECDKRPGLLVDIMELLESSGLNMEQASIACFEHLVFDGLGSMVEDIESEDDRHLSSSVSAEDVRANLVSLIADERLENQM